MKQPKQSNMMPMAWCQLVERNTHNADWIFEMATSIRPTVEENGDPMKLVTSEETLCVIRTLSHHKSNVAWRWGNMPKTTPEQGDKQGDAKYRVYSYS
jgi:hypothetical protein